jgi:hypothetical protein
MAESSLTRAFGRIHRAAGLWEPDWTDELRAARARGRSSAEPIGAGRDEVGGPRDPAALRTQAVRTLKTPRAMSIDSGTGEPVVGDGVSRDVEEASDRDEVGRPERASNRLNDLGRAAGPTGAIAYDRIVRSESARSARGPNVLPTLGGPGGARPASAECSE